MRPRGTAMACDGTRTGGSVLILVMWTLVFLSALAIAVASYVDAGLRLAGKMKNLAGAGQAARAGVEKAIMDAAADTNSWDSFDESWNSSEDLFKDVPLGEGFYSIQSVRRPSGGQAVTNYGLVDEESRININTASRELITAGIEAAGGVDHGTAVELAASIVDWRDPDDDALTGGAEKSYYQGLDQSYRCRNAEFQTMRELLLVKGVSYDLFVKIAPYLTVHGAGRVNINTADEAVLKSVARVAGGADATVADSLAGKIAGFRGGGGVFKAPVPAEIVRQLKQSVALTPAEEGVLAGMMGMLTTQSGCFGGVATGRMKNSAADEVAVEFVFDREKGSKLNWYVR
ncbi:MAG: hypothetical protein C0404_07445 [Verrucomicrobia bacterium]|nr:hypothetical protein [Verrucomicrobiota bacterium]